VNIDGIRYQIREKKAERGSGKDLKEVKC